MKLKRIFTLRKEDFVTFLFIAIVAIISFWTTDSTVISSDDWSSVIKRVVFGELDPFLLTDRRPLVFTLYFVLASLFGMHVPSYYLFNFVVLFLSAWMIYIIGKRVFGNQTWLASLIAIVSIVYPVDYTRTWLIMLYIHFWWFISLVGIWLFLEFSKTGKIWQFALAIIGIALPLGAYEGQFGVVMFACALIAIVPKSPSKRRLMIAIGVLSIGFAFIGWRMFLQDLLFSINDAYLAKLQFDLATLLTRYRQGIYIFLKGWLDPIQIQLKLSDFNLELWALAYSIICCIVIIWVETRPGIKNNISIFMKTESVKKYFTGFLAGFAFWVAGFLPIIALYTPSLSGNVSRVNFFAIPGASIMFVAIILILATIISNSIAMRRLITLSLLTPFIVAGIFVQHQVNQENHISWETQKKIWNGVFTTIPNIHDQRGIVIIIPGYQSLRPFQTNPFLAAWEIEAGAQVLYNNPTIGAYYYYKDIEPSEIFFTHNGFSPLPHDKTIPYKKLIFVMYEPKTESVSLIDDLEAELSLSHPVKNYYPQENILMAKANIEEHRWLVNR